LYATSKPVGLSSTVRRFLDENAGLQTPFLVVDLDMVESAYHALAAALPGVEILYAVKANPATEVLERLADLGSSFDVASPGEIERCLKIGIEPERLSYGNTVKKEADIAYAWGCGIRTFAADSAAELDKLVRQAPESTVYIRIDTDGAGADWPLSRKFGCDAATARDLLCRAARADLAVGVSFHVGSQQRDATAWDRPLARVGALVAELADAGVTLAGVNLGGGFPSRYREQTAPISAYGAAIADSLRRHLGDFGGTLVAEPGRYLVGDAGVIESEVVLVAGRPNADAARWVYLDVGVFNGLAETLGEAIRYRIDAPADRGPLEPAILAGPSCDSADVLYEKSGCALPAGLRAGDRIRLLATGAYTSSYSSVWFNGFEPLRSYFVSEHR